MKKDFQELVEEKYGSVRADNIAVRLSQMPTIYRAAYKRATNHKSMRAAVNSFCLECVGYMRKEVSVCSDTGCPLYSYRPYQKRTGADDTPSGFSGEAERGRPVVVESTNPPNTGKDTQERENVV